MNAYSFDVFLSYAHEDRAFARSVVGWLRKSGRHVWIDEEQLIPGSRFRAGLQQGLRESRHLAIVLTSAYASRNWTQRELDLFDLEADHSERKVLAIQIGNLLGGDLDQVILVHQRIFWNGVTFDAEAFWQLNCGLAGIRPGRRDEWRDKGLALISPSKSSRAAKDLGRSRLSSDGPISGNDPFAAVRRLAEYSLDHESPHWQRSFQLLRSEVGKTPSAQASEQQIEAAWAMGHAEIAAVLSLAMKSQTPQSRSFHVWPFIDLSCLTVAEQFLINHAISSGESEIWFSWTVCTQQWELLPSAAAKAPELIRNHFELLAASAEPGRQSYESVEAAYDYGVMITPWNHFHLSWLADRLGDWTASVSHARALCAIGARGDRRAARFINRLTTWPTFFQHRRSDELSDRLAQARDRLGMSPEAKVPSIQARLTEIWNSLLNER